MASAAEYEIKINRKEGTLEVAGPDQDWITATIEQLSPLLSDHWPELAPDSSAAGQRTPRSGNAKKTESSATDSEADETKPRRARGARGRSEINQELRSNLTTRRQELQDYVAARRNTWDRSQPAQAAIIATFLNDELGLTGVDRDDLYTVYTVMGERSPSNIQSQLTNARQRARYFSHRENGKMVLSHAGENFARFDSLDTASDSNS